MSNLQIDADEIMIETLAAFDANELQVDYYNELHSTVGNITKDDYIALYYNYLVPTNIKIDHELFEHEIKRYDRCFEQWGKTLSTLPRKACALVNYDGLIKENDQINRSLYEWNIDNPNRPTADSDFRKPTEILDLPSLEPLNILDPYWCRSNILRWDEGAKFLPHIDCMHNHTHSLRLWGTTTNNIRLRFHNGFNQMIEHDDVEPGRIYLIDTATIHDARCIEGRGYQFFLSVLPRAYDLLKEIIQPQENVA